jgi:hypothetical protein
VGGKNNQFFGVRPQFANYIFSAVDADIFCSLCPEPIPAERCSKILLSGRRRHFSKCAQQFQLFGAAFLRISFHLYFCLFVHKNFPSLNTPKTADSFLPAVPAFI